MTPGHAAGRCDCHEWHSIAEISGWLHGSTPGTLAPVHEWPGRADFWENAVLSHEELTARISAAGGVACECALKARTDSDGTVRLEDGAHRWTVCRERGIVWVPVRMTYVPTEDVWPWP
jgi:hypothetical protein